jgi:CRISPR/Cas system-associated exonuclease Cas4 (RecB family)
MAGFSGVNFDSFSKGYGSFPNGANFITLSVSKSKCFKQCKAKFHFSYIQKLPKKEMDFQIFGTFLHEVLEKFEKEIISGSTLRDNVLIKNIYKEVLEGEEKKEPGKLRLTKDQAKECFDILCDFLYYRAQLKKDGKLFTSIAAEKSFNVNIQNKILLNGFIDFVKRDIDGVLHVADYKTSKNSKYLEKDFLQLKTYAYIMCLEDPTLDRVRCSYVMLRDKFRPVMVEYKRSDLIDVENNFIEFADSINNEKLFRPSTGSLCKYCDFLNDCEAGQNKVSCTKQFGQISW